MFQAEESNVQAWSWVVPSARPAGELGVLLGAVCGVVLYCACWHNGMSERNLSALENYNFELVDGVKLKKDKLNTQSTYSEA